MSRSARYLWGITRVEYIEFVPSGPPDAKAGRMYFDETHNTFRLCEDSTHFELIRDIVYLSSSSSSSRSSSSSSSLSSSSRSSSSSSKSSSSNSSSSSSSRSSSSSSSKSSSSSSSRSSSFSSSKSSSSSSSSESSSSSSSSRSSSSSSSSYQIPENDFLTDLNCYALYNFESGALNVDSKGTNTLITGNAADEDIVNYRQGLCSALFVNANSDYYYVPDASLDTGFPLKSGDSQKIISICAWVRSVATGAADVIAGKYNYTSNLRSIVLLIDTDNVVKLRMGYNSGASQEVGAHLTTLTRDGSVWYHITASYQQTGNIIGEQAYAIRIRDISGNVVGSDLTDIATLDGNGLAVTIASMTVGCNNQGDTPASYFDGNIDELVIFNRFLTAEESTEIALKTYENSSSSSSSRSSSSSSSSSFSESGDIVTFGGDTVTFDGDTVRW